jgi:hypothetical protein
MPRKGHTEEQILQALRQAKGGESGRDLPEVGDQRADVLHLEEEVCGNGAERAARVTAATRGEWHAEEAGGGPLARPSHAAGDCPKKALKPRHRRVLAHWTQAAYQVSERRVSRLVPIPRSSLRYEGHLDPQEALRMRLRESAASRVRFG